MLLKRFKNEKGSISLEFLGVLPFLFVFVFLLWQVVAIGMAALSAQSAVSEAAQVYALDQDFSEAEQKAIDIVGSGDIMTFSDFTVTPTDPDGDFEAELTVNLDLVFLPDSWSASTIPFTLNTSSRVLE